MRRIIHLKILGIGLVFFFSGLGPALDAVGEEPAVLKIGVIGDSTVQTYAENGARRGWGQMMGEFLDPRVAVLNEALSGTSTKSFPAERWQRILDWNPDFVLIQFAHNDQKKQDPNRYTEPNTAYRENLRRYATEARAIGAQPIFVTPVRRRTFRDGKLSDSLHPYVNAMKAKAVELGVPLIDLHATSGELYSRLGEDGSTPYTLNNLDREDQPGRGDRTHFTVVGARGMAYLVVRDFAKVEPRVRSLARLSENEPLPE